MSTWRVHLARPCLRLAERWAVTRFLAEAMAVGFLRAGDYPRLDAMTYGEPSSIAFYDPTRYRIAAETCIMSELREQMPGTRLLDAFCGQAREAELFANAGFQVTGLDRSPEMIHRARQHAERAGFDATWIAADFDAFESEVPFDIVYTSLWMYSTYCGASKRMELLHRCRQLTHDDGLIVVSYHPIDENVRFRYSVNHWIARLAAVMTMGNWSVAYGDRIIYRLFRHAFTTAHIEQEVDQAGMRIVARKRCPDVAVSFLLLRPS